MGLYFIAIYENDKSAKLKIFIFTEYIVIGYKLGPKQSGRAIFGFFLENFLKLEIGEIFLHDLCKIRHLHRITFAKNN